MLTLKQVLWFASAICVGNILAVLLHCGTWKLRHRAMKVLVAVGYLTLPLSFLALSIYYGGEWNKWNDMPSDTAAIGHKALLIQLLGLLTTLFIGFLGLGFLHSRQLKVSWHQAAMACYTEFVFALLIVCVFGFVFLNAAFSLKGSNSYFELMRAGKACLSCYCITLVALAICRPFVLKIYSQLLQMKPDWFRLSYQWKKSKF